MGKKSEKSVGSQFNEEGKIQSFYLFLTLLKKLNTITGPMFAAGGMPMGGCTPGLP